MTKSIIYIWKNLMAIFNLSRTKQKNENFHMYVCTKYLYNKEEEEKQTNDSQYTKEKYSSWRRKKKKNFDYLTNKEIF